MGIFRGHYILPWRRKWQSTPALLPGKSHGWRSLIGYTPWGLKESDTIEWLHFHIHFPILSTAISTVDTMQVLLGFGTQDLSISLISLIIGNSFCSALHDLPWIPMGRFNLMLVKEGKEWETKEIQTVKSHLGTRSCIPISGYMQQYLWAILQILKSPPGGRN